MFKLISRGAAYSLTIVCTLVFAAVPAAAQSLPSVTITPTGRLITVASREVEVTIKFCQFYDGDARDSYDFHLGATDVIC